MQLVNNFLSPKGLQSKAGYNSWIKVGLQLLIIFSCCVYAVHSEARQSELVNHTQQHPRLVINCEDIKRMKQGIANVALFKKAFLAVKRKTDKQLSAPINVPVPKDAGGGYSHEQHKRNYRTMYNAGLLWQLTGDRKYAEWVKNVLIEYARLYPGLPIHPQAKSSNKGRLFWQGLNEAVWLVYTSQAYDFIVDSLTTEERNLIENNLLREVAKFLSVDSANTFQRIHNHATWSAAAVGMTGLVLDDSKLVEIALKGLDNDGKSGFLRQIELLFSPQGYYTEGPYYQRYALMPFITFAKALQNNRPALGIFKYADKKILKAVYASIQLSYRGKLFPLNDSIKDKTLKTPELISAVAIAFGISGDRHLLDIAQWQNEIVLSGDGLSVANALAQNQALPFVYKSGRYGDGASGDQGALLVMRTPSNENALSNDTTLVMKATSQGMGHGHFDRLSWLFFDNGEEIVSDYGASRFLNVEAKYGGRYLKTNKTWARQTVAHNTLVVDQTSQFQAKTKQAEKSWPTDIFFKSGRRISLARAKENSAWPGVALERTMALVKTEQMTSPIVIDLLKVKSKKWHQFDLPVHYHGHLISSNLSLNWSQNSLVPMGTQFGYQHLWQTGTGSIKSDGDKNPVRITWLNNNGRFYTHHSKAYDCQYDRVSAANSRSCRNSSQQVLFGLLGANDPSHDLRAENSFVLRHHNKSDLVLLNILEPHGEYNPQIEYTVASQPLISQSLYLNSSDVDVIAFKYVNQAWLLAVRTQPSQTNENKTLPFEFQGKTFQLTDDFQLFPLKNLQADRT